MSAAWSLWLMHAARWACRSSSPRPAPYTVYRKRCRSRRVLRRPPSTLTAAPSSMAESVLHDYDAAYGLRSAVLRYFNAAGADPEGSDRRVPRRRDPPRAADDRRGAWHEWPPDRPGGRLPDRGRHRRSRLHPRSPTSRTRTSRRSMRSWRAAPRRPTTSAPADGYSVRQVIEAVERATGLKVPHRFGA